MPEPEESAAKASGEPSAHGQKKRHTRTRSSCERCRTQRRKCDGKRPQCMRCASAGTTCNYATRIAFKIVNPQEPSKDVSPNSAGVPTSSKKYETIMFVVNDGGPGQTKPSGLSSSSTVNSADRVIPPTSFQVAPEKPLGLVSDDGWPLFGQCSLSTVETELMKHYIHRISPWVSKQGIALPWQYLPLNSKPTAFLVRRIRPKANIHPARPKTSDNLPLRSRIPSPSLRRIQRPTNRCRNTPRRGTFPPPRHA